jgi:hypothetical protein
MAAAAFRFATLVLSPLNQIGRGSAWRAGGLIALTLNRDPCIAGGEPGMSVYIGLPWTTRSWPSMVSAARGVALGFPGRCGVDLAG